RVVEEEAGTETRGAPEVEGDQLQLEARGRRVEDREVTDDPHPRGYAHSEKALGAEGLLPEGAADVGDQGDGLNGLDQVRGDELPRVADVAGGGRWGGWEGDGWQESLPPAVEPGTRPPGGGGEKAGEPARARRVERSHEIGWGWIPPPATIVPAVV